MSKQLKVSANLAQDLTDEQKAQARANISAASEANITSINSVIGGQAARISALENSSSGRYVPVGAVVSSSTAATTPIATGEILKVSALVTNQSYMQLVIEPVDTTKYQLQSCVAQLTDTLNSSNSSIRILNPYAQSGSPSAYSGYIVYGSEALGIGSIDVMAHDIEENTFSYHKADVLWYCPTGASVYCINVILKEKA